MECMNKIIEKMNKSSLIWFYYLNYQIKRTDFTEPGTISPEIPYFCIYSETETKYHRYKVG